MNSERDHTLFDVAAVNGAIAETRFFGHLHHLGITSSTQSVALAAAASGERCGVWVADQQTAGRGRGAHTWLSAPDDSLLLSALVTPVISVQSAMLLSLVTALAAQSAIAELIGFEVPAELDLRWPNDLLLRGRKVGGILIESAAAPPVANQPAALRYAVIGVGINCNQLSFPPELQMIATSLRSELPDGTALVSRELLMGELLRQLHECIETFLRDPASPCREFPERSTWASGKRVSVPEDGGYTGVTAGLTPDGFLLVAADDGTTRTVRSGGVRAL